VGKGVQGDEGAEVETQKALMSDEPKALTQLVCQLVIEGSGE